MDGEDLEDFKKGWKEIGRPIARTLIAAIYGGMGRFGIEDSYEKADGHLAVLEKDLGINK